MTLRQCRVPGCDRSAASRYSSYCPAHRKRDKRHGHPLQEAITVRALKPYRKRIERVLEGDNPNGKHRKRLEDACRALTWWAKDYLRKPVRIRHYRQAAQAILAVFEENEPEAVGTVIGGMVLMWREEPRRFRSDEGFFFQMARRFRGLSDQHIGVTFDRKLGKTRKTHRDYPPRATRALSEMLIEAFKTFVAGVVIATESETAKTIDRLEESSSRVH